MAPGYGGKMTLSGKESRSIIHVWQGAAWANTVAVSKGAIVWKYSYDASDHLNHWIYQPRSGEDVSLFAAMMKEAMNGAVVNMAQTVPALMQ